MTTADGGPRTRNSAIQMADVDRAASLLYNG
jgi:hypothetical protein